MKPTIRNVPPPIDGNVTSLHGVRLRLEEPETRWHRLLSVVRGKGTAVTLLVLAFALALGGVLRRYDQWKTAGELRRQVLEQYLLYMNSDFDEYNIAYPLSLLPQEEDESLSSGRDHEVLTGVLTGVHEAHRRRLDAYARMQSLAVALSAFPGERTGELEHALVEADKRSNVVSGKLETWVHDSYCMHVACENSLGRNRDDTYRQYEELMKIRALLVEDRAKDAATVELLKSQFK